MTVGVTIGGPTITLSNGVEMPQVGLGTWQSTPEEVKTAVRAAIETGYRLIDTAAAYKNEEEIGEVIQEFIAEGKIKREDIFITTKLFGSSLHPKDAEPEIRESLRRLKVDYVDLYLAHVPTCFYDKSVTVTDVWKAFEAIYEKGLAKAIGVSNFTAEQIERIMEIATVPIHNLQVELHLYWPQHELQETCKKHNISITSYATLGSPGRTNFKSMDGTILDWPSAPNDLDDPNVKKLAEKYGKTPAQILLRYVMDRGIAVIPKSVNPSRITENFQLFDFSLSASEIEELETAPHRQRLFFLDFMKGHPEDSLASERKG